MAIKIICRPNGPYLVENDGSVELYDATGTKVDLTGKPKFALCRCGGATPKPFCRGTHSKNGFQAAEAAAAQQKPRRAAHLTRVRPRPPPFRGRGYRPTRGWAPA